MAANDFYKFQYYTTESLYEKVTAEGHSFTQAADRCLTEFRYQLDGGGVPALAVYSTLFSGLAFHSPRDLRYFRQHIDAMECLLTPATHAALSEEELEELTDDIDAIRQELQ